MGTSMIESDEPNESSNEESNIWDAILDGDRDPLEIIYVANDVKDDELHLEELEHWGEVNGLWTIHLVNSCEEAIKLNNRIAADVIILLNCWVMEAYEIAEASPQTPIS